MQVKADREAGLPRGMKLVVDMWPEGDRSDVLACLASHPLISCLDLLPLAESKCSHWQRIWRTTEVSLSGRQKGRRTPGLGAGSPKLQLCKSLLSSLSVSICKMMETDLTACELLLSGSDLDGPLEGRRDRPCEMLRESAGGRLWGPVLCPPRQSLVLRVGSGFSWL